MTTSSTQRTTAPSKDTEQPVAETVDARLPIAVPSPYTPSHLRAERPAPQPVQDDHQHMVVVDLFGTEGFATISDIPEG